MLRVKKGDTRKAIRATLTDNGAAVDLTGLIVKISIENKVYEANCIIEDALNGKVAYPLDGLTNEAGIFNYEFIIVYPDGREQSVPNGGYFKLYVMDEVK